MIAGVHGARHDSLGYRRYGVMILRRATRYRVIPGKGRISIACVSSDRSGTNGRRRAPTKIEMHREGGHVSVHLDVSDAPTSIAGQRQIGG